jgi:hypothetical protein
VNIAEMTLLELADAYEIDNLPAGEARGIEAELARRQAMLDAAEVMAKYSRYADDAPVSVSPTAAALKALAAYESAKGGR